MHLKVIHGLPAPDTPTERVRKRVRAMKKPAPMLQCPRCGGREIVQTRIGVLQGRPRSGTAVDLCASCYMRGERVALT